MENNVSLVAMVTNQNGQTVEADSGVGYISFSPNATSEEALVYLRNSRSQVMSIAVEAASGRVTVRQLAAEEVETLGFGNNRIKIWQKKTVLRLLRYS